jgi:hypothetical protein
MSKFDIIGEASQTVANYIFLGRYGSFFRISGQTSEGNRVEVWHEYVDENGRQATYYRWRVWGNYNQVGDADVVIAKGQLAEFSPQTDAIIAAFEQERLLDARVDYLEKEISEIRSGDLSRQHKIETLDMGRIE